MKRETGIAFLVSACLVTGCSGAGRPETFYVVISPAEAEQYYRDMIAAVTLLELDANPGTANDNRGRTLYVMEGTGRGVRVWSVNLPLSQRQSEACGGPSEPTISETEYVVTVSMRNPFRKDQVPAVAAGLRSSLQEQGYEIRDTPWICGRNDP